MRFYALLRWHRVWIIVGLMLLAGFVFFQHDTTSAHLSYQMEYQSSQVDAGRLRIDCEKLTLSKHRYSFDGLREVKQLQDLSEGDCLRIYVYLSQLPKQVVSPVFDPMHSQSIEWFTQQEALSWHWQGKPTPALAVVFQHLDNLAARIPPTPSLAGLNSVSD